MLISLQRGAYRSDFRRRVAKPPLLPPAVDPPAVDPTQARRPWKALVVAGALVSLVAAAAFIFPLLARRNSLAESGGVIAVLPFANATAGPGTDYVCYGLVEDLTTALTGIEDVRVIARASASQFAAMGLDLIDVGRKLGDGLRTESRFISLVARMSLAQP